MENSETQQQLLNLGKKLAENFKDNNKGDETSEWMAHYLAEKITGIEQAHGKAKDKEQKDCFRAILTLWEYQALFPDRLGPFSEFESVFRAISSLDTDKNMPRYYRYEEPNEETPKEIQDYVHLIKGLDEATRTMITFFIREAILISTNESTLKWLESIHGIAHSDEAQVVLNILPELNVDNIDGASVQNEKRKIALSENIERLKAFEQTSKSIRLLLSEKFDELE